MPSLKITVALVGNPNTGKSTLFNALSGLRQHVGNYPGVTVEMKSGSYSHAGIEFEIIDLPGTYSLAPRSPDEMVAVDLMLGRATGAPKPDVILSIVDASNLERNLYLTTQLMELGLPVVLAVNMIDVAAGQGIQIAIPELAKAIGIPVVGIQANAGKGLAELKDALKQSGPVTGHGPQMPALFEVEANALRKEVGEHLSPFLARRLLLDVGGYTEQWLTKTHGNGLQKNVADARNRLAASGCAIPAIEAKTRYAWIRSATSQAVTKPARRPVTRSDRLDRIFTHRIWGTAIFLLVMLLMFQSIFVAAEPLAGWIDDATKWLSGLVEKAIDPGPFRSLVADGVIGGVGGVIKFLPQILILFGFIAVLEDCGYMAQAAFLMDRLMSRCGLSGKSFIPLLSSVACAVPGILATRVIENRRDRIATIVVAPLMSCSARLPVYALLTGAFLTEGFAWWVPGLTLFGLYMIGFLAAPLAALLLKRTLLRGSPPLFVMEMPAFKRPSVKLIVRRMVDAGWAFLYRAGTFILMSMIVVWALLYFPATDGLTAYESRIEELKNAEKVDEASALRAEWKRNSYLGRTGRFLEPVFQPLGWDWKLGMASLASFPAREVIVGTLGILYSQGDVDAGDDEQRSQLGRAIQQEWKDDPIRGKYGIAVALSVMVFFALCCQCASTLAVIRRETRSWTWPVFTFAYMTGLAYLGSLATYQIGRIVIDAMG